MVNIIELDLYRERRAAAQKVIAKLGHEQLTNL
ncbi:MAG: hypothetical protein CM15mP100_3450 [Alphaproteobacteria bacterium]|nr:MAG: hypothetical protein CM15mP100_3450 [Alphaproteobacteria bacterium]